MQNCNGLGPHPVSSIHIYTFVVSRAFMADSQAGDADSSRAPGLTSGLQGSVNVIVVLYCWCHSGSASVLSYFYIGTMLPYLDLPQRVKKTRNAHMVHIVNN